MAVDGQCRGGDDPAAQRDTWTKDTIPLIGRQQVKKLEL